MRSQLLVCLLVLVGCGGEPEKPPPMPKQPVISTSSGAFLPNRLSIRLINGKVVSVEVG